MLNRLQDEVLSDLLDRSRDVLATVALAQRENLLTHDAGALEVAGNQAVVAEMEVASDGVRERQLTVRRQPGQLSFMRHMRKPHAIVAKP